MGAITNLDLISSNADLHDLLVGGIRVLITTNFAWSTSNPAAKILCPKTIPYVAIKWHFSQFRARFLS